MLVRVGYEVVVDDEVGMVHLLFHLRVEVVEGQLAVK
jgi:hypothetical protein